MNIFKHIQYITFLRTESYQLKICIQYVIYYKCLRLLLFFNA